MKKIIAEFKEFISKGNVLDMAVGLIVGSAFTAVVTALVSFLRSLISCFNIWGEPDTSFLDIHFLNGTIQLSALVEAVVSFLIIAVAVFFLVKGVNFLRSRAKKEEEEKKEQAKPDPQLELLTEIRDLLRQQAQTSAPEQEILPRLEEEEHGHDHGQFDPHVWLSPVNAKKEMENIKNAYVKADPENKDYYEKNYQTYTAEFDKLDQEYKDTLSALPNKSIVVSHEAFGYLCDAYGLTQMGIEGLSPDSEPDPARMAEIIDFVKANHVKVIFFEELVSPKVAETIAAETGAQTQVLNPLEGLSDEELKNGADYFSVMEDNLKQLKAALE